MDIVGFLWNNLHIIAPVVGAVGVPVIAKMYRGKKAKMNNDVTDLLVQVRKKQEQLNKRAKSIF